MQKINDELLARSNLTSALALFIMATSVVAGCKSTGNRSRVREAINNPYATQPVSVEGLEVVWPRNAYLFINSIRLVGSENNPQGAGSKDYTFEIKYSKDVLIQNEKLVVGKAPGQISGRGLETSLQLVGERPPSNGIELGLEARTFKKTFKLTLSDACDGHASSASTLRVFPKNAIFQVDGSRDAQVNAIANYALTCVEGRQNLAFTESSMARGTAVVTTSSEAYDGGAAESSGEMTVEIPRQPYILITSMRLVSSEKSGSSPGSKDYTFELQYGKENLARNEKIVIDRLIPGLYTTGYGYALRLVAERAPSEGIEIGLQAQSVTRTFQMKLGDVCAGSSITSTTHLRIAPKNAYFGSGIPGAVDNAIGEYTLACVNGTALLSYVQSRAVGGNQVYTVTRE